VIQTCKLVAFWSPQRRLVDACEGKAVTGLRTAEWSATATTWESKLNPMPGEWTRPVVERAQSHSSAGEYSRHGETATINPETERGGSCETGWCQAAVKEGPGAGACLCFLVPKRSKQKKQRDPWLLFLRRRRMSRTADFPRAQWILGNAKSRGQNTGSFESCSRLAPYSDEGRMMAVCYSSVQSFIGDCRSSSPRGLERSALLLRLLRADCRTGKASCEKTKVRTGEIGKPRR